MCRSIVLLEGKPSAQSKVRNALDWVFIKAISIFWCIELFFYSDVSLSPCRWKNSPTAWGCYQDTLLLGWYFAGDEQCLVSFKQDAWNWGSSDQRILFLTVWGSFRCFFANSKCVFMCLHWREDWVINAIKPRAMECCSGVCPSVDFSHLHIWSWSSTRVTIRFFVTTLTKALLHQLASNFLFWTLPQMCGLTQTCFWALQAVILTPGLVFCSNMHYQLLDLLLRCVCLSKSYPFNWICHRLISLEV